MKFVRLLAQCVPVMLLASTACAQVSTAPTDAQRSLIAMHYKAYSADGDAARIFPLTTTPDWSNCGANGAVCQTREELAGLLGGLKQGVPDLKWEVLDVLATGDKLIVRGQGLGTPKGVFMGMPTQGRAFKIMSIDIQTIRDGKIAHTYHLEDWAEAIRQLSGR